MAKLSDVELIDVIDFALDHYVSARTVDPDNVCRSAAEAVARAIREAGAIVVREERRGNLHGAEVVVLRAHRRAPSKADVR